MELTEYMFFDEKRMKLEISNIKELGNSHQCGD
jgi:hypothetical protein